MAKGCLNKMLQFCQLIVISVCLIAPCKAEAQSREQLLKAGYIEKFTHFVDWKNNQHSNDSLFRIAVFGDDKFRLALEEIFRYVKVKDKNVRISSISSVNQINNNLILVIPESVGPAKLDEILNYTTGKPILTISEKKGYGRKGTIINLIVVDDYIRYEVNRITLGKTGLKMSSLLIKTAILVSTDE